MASCDEELNWHLSNDHEQEEDVSDDPELYSCNICGKRNVDKGQLMVHRKSRHSKSIKTCSYFLKGICDFPDNVCWFSHNPNVNTTKPQTLKQFNCNMCGCIFKNKSEFMKHRKIEHPNNISPCRDFNSGYCRLDAKTCWYTHDDKECNPHNENSESVNSMMNRLFTMMEQFGERMKNLEMQI